MSTTESNKNEKILLRMNDAMLSLGLNKSKVADLIGYSKGQTGWVLDGKAPLSDKFVTLFCHGINISENWLRSGEGQMRPEHSHINETETAYQIDDTITLRAVIEAVEEYLQSEKRNLAPAKKAELIIMLYEMFSEEEGKQVDKKTVAKLIRLAS